MCLLMSALGSLAKPDASPGSGLRNASPIVPPPGASSFSDNALPAARTNALLATSTLRLSSSTTNTCNRIARERADRAATTEPSATPNVAPADGINVMETLDDQHTLAIGDVLSFRIVEDEEDARSMTVTDAGDLEVPCLGRFPTEQRTCKQLALALKAALEKEYYYQATVILAVNSMTKSRGKVYLAGPIRMPGVQDLPSDEVLTVSKAILRAGGFNDFADRKHVKITREGSPGKAGKETLVVDVGQIYDAGRTELDVALNPGDLIYIPERLVHF